MRQQQKASVPKLLESRLELDGNHHTRLDSRVAAETWKQHPQRIGSPLGNRTGLRLGCVGYIRPAALPQCGRGSTSLLAIRRIFICRQAVVFGGIRSGLRGSFVKLPLHILVHLRACIALDVSLRRGKLPLAVPPGLLLAGDFRVPNGNFALNGCGSASASASASSSASGGSRGGGSRGGGGAGALLRLEWTGGLCRVTRGRRSTRAVLLRWALRRSARTASRAGVITGSVFTTCFGGWLWDEASAFGFAPTGRCRPGVLDALPFDALRFCCEVVLPWAEAAEAA
eukprot:scaffold613_cov243-Pinguiococcus_pyrenoidosus.AAC.14